MSTVAPWETFRPSFSLSQSSYRVADQVQNTSFLQLQRHLCDSRTLNMSDHPETTELSSDNSGFAQRRKQHLALVNQLRTMGAQADLDLPRIAVIGNQSAGKSSLIEAITGINFPRDAGTCTRCPMECRLFYSPDSWRCQVSLRMEYDLKSEQPLDEVRVHHYASLSSKREVPLALRRAQSYLLNSNYIQNLVEVSTLIMSTNEAELQQLQNRRQFSSNTVCIDIYGPEYTDLAFVDLPGIIQNAEPNIVQSVENMVLDHIEGNCLILVTLPMSDDIENQKAMRLAKQVDPQGTRTIGVLTKPDTLTPGATKSRDLWLQVIEGNRSPLQHGYYCTRQPDDDERMAGITNLQAREKEREFFANTAPWCNSTHKTRFGTHYLIETLSKLFVSIIDASILNLREEVDKQIKSCNSHLSKLPKLVTSEPSSYVLQLLTSYCTTVDRQVRGDPNCPDVVQHARRIYAGYKKDICASAPQFVPYPNPGIEEGNEGNTLGYHGAQSRGRGRPLYLQDVRRQIENAITRELPGNVPYAAKTAFMIQCQENWLADSVKCYEAVYSNFRATLVRLSDDVFGQFVNLKEQIHQYQTELMAEKGAATISEVEKILKRERIPFTQNNHYLQVTKSKCLAKFKGMRAGQVDSDGQNGNESTDFEGDNGDAKVESEDNSDSEAVYGASSDGPVTPKLINSSGFRTRLFDNSDAISKKAVHAIIANLAYLGLQGVTEDDLAKLVPPDPYEQEMDIMAEVEAYFRVAYKRVIDVIPMTIDHSFLFSFSESLQNRLIEKLGLGSNNSEARCTAYLAEDPKVAAERDEVMAKKKRLEAVQDELYRYGFA
ncbi:hypothetical protein K474DRAFT_477367 [Panus rudis PR-1116 ss-1]|nr:hypothetical protein K474DRAFT_477367 [Panus rudis PR-1116 ss-1]